MCVGSREGDRDEGDVKRIQYEDRTEWEMVRLRIRGADANFRLRHLCTPVCVCGHRCFLHCETIFHPRDEKEGQGCV